jgi:hypothetical protein
LLSRENGRLPPTPSLSPWFISIPFGSPINGPRYFSISQTAAALRRNENVMTRHRLSLSEFQFECVEEYIILFSKMSLNILYDKPFKRYLYHSVDPTHKTKIPRKSDFRNSFGQYYLISSPALMGNFIFSLIITLKLKMIKNLQSVIWNNRFVNDGDEIFKTREQILISMY